MKKNSNKIDACSTSATFAPTPTNRRATAGLGRSPRHITHRTTRLQLIQQETPRGRKAHPEETLRQGSSNRVIASHYSAYHEGLAGQMTAQSAVGWPATRVCTNGNERPRRQLPEPAQGEGQSPGGTRQIVAREKRSVPLFTEREGTKRRKALRHVGEQSAPTAAHHERAK